MTTTEIVMSVTVVMLIGYDTYAAIQGGLHATISYQLTQLSKTYPVIPFAFGLLMGHFFAQ